MKKSTSILIGVIVLALIVVFILFRDKEKTAIENIDVPINNITIANGVWKIYKKETISDKEKNINYEVGKFYIDKSIVVFGSRFTINPSFSSKLVNLQKYLSSKYKAENKFGESKKVVVTISDGSRFYQDVIVMDKNNIIVPFGGTLYYMIKTEDSISKSFIKNYQAMYEKKYYQGNDTNQKNNETISLILGIKNKVRKNRENDISYRSILLNFDKNNNTEIYQTKNLILPRKNGFWTIEYSKNSLNSNYINQLIAKPVYSDTNSKELSKVEIKYPLEITYLGPEYISIIKESESEDEYSIYDIDKMTDNNELNINQIGGKEATVALKNSIAKESNENDFSLSFGDTFDNYKNIGIVRDSGKWIYQTQFNLRRNNEVKLKTINLNIVSHLNLSIDELAMNWSAIKNLKTEAIDAYSSPDKRILIVQTNDEILIYDHQNSNKLLGSIPIEVDDSIVMSEWAIGNYAKLWKKEFKNNEKLPASFIIN